MLPKKNRLTKRKDFDLILKKGKAIKEGFLFFKFLPKKNGDSRFGIIVSKKISKKATVRNKLKRRIRALLRIKIKKLKKNVDGILIALPGLEEKKFQEIEFLIDNLFKRANLF